MNEKDLIEWARKKSADESDLSIEDARAQLTEEEEASRQEMIAKMKQLGVADPQIATDVLQAEKADKARAIEAKRIAAEERALAKEAQEDADQLDLINAWRLDDGLPTVGDLSDAADDEMEAAWAGDSKLLIRNKRRLT